IYALGVLIFESLTGRPPRGLELPSELRPDLDARWDRILKRALARDPDKRFSHVRELRSEVMSVLARVPLRKPEPSPDGEAPRRPALPARVREPPPLPLDDMVSIPAGKVSIGDAASPEARPVLEIELAAFRIDRTPVTNSQYHAFVLATGARPPRVWGGKPKVVPRALPRAIVSLPVTGVTWDEAAAFAAWAKKRLPTEAEWERAARGRSGRDFPYGDSFDEKKINADQKALAPVDAYQEGASDEGVLDLTGNAWEWCEDVHGPYPPSSAKGSAKGAARVIRGGYDPGQPGSGSAWFRGCLRHDVANPRVGFRCARSGS
ncbi:SUMF1/EgtB/PvdO family nonheme iron enzyme, partial [bacterium]|nr:SUMF1/EgtB/PvdO family nonheme iron enzyme [bacterium]